MVRTILLALFAVSVGCGGASAQQEEKMQEAGALAAVAGAAAVVGVARSQGTSGAKRAGECCAICDRCSFPCGDECLPNGTVCLKPQGCACYDSEVPSSERPRTDAPCALGAGTAEPDGRAVVVPIVSD
ncbi:MAG: hypothetical protein PHU25_12365 [Deltaproteobacteria bacterium]|nr:hypothetical protein [Deltaproteobacteria bacterium]